MAIELTKEQLFEIKKFMAFVLRHKPYFYNVKLDSEGYALQRVIVRAIAKNKKISITQEQLVEICKRHSGGIFLVKDDKVKARDGHTVTLNMAIPSGFAVCQDVPNTLFCLLDRAEVGKILVNDGISFGDAKVTMTKTQTNAEGKSVVTIHSSKAKSDSVKFYHNPNTDEYYARHIAARYLSVHV